MSHTPGPWKVSKAIFDAEDGEVGYVLEGVKQSRSDDAALIEAAPDMYEVLEELGNAIYGREDVVVRHLDGAVFVWIGPDCAQKIMSAIKKARGTNEQ